MQHHRERTPTPPPRDLDTIDQQIARLEAERTRALLARSEKARLDGLQNGAKVLVGASPSPKKRRREEEVYFKSGAPSFDLRQERASTSAAVPFRDAQRTVKKRVKEEDDFLSVKPRGKSNFAAGLQANARQSKEDVSRRKETKGRSTGFGEGFEVTKREREAREAAKEKEQQREILREKEAASSRTTRNRRHSNDDVPTSRAKASPVQSSHSNSDEDADLDVVGGPPGGPTRRHDMTLIENLVPGPKSHAPISGDPLYNTLEPNSMIRLRPKSRVISHEMLQSHLTGRYHLSPSLLYSHVRPPTHQSSNLEVDLVGDFIVIAVLAWKDEPRFRNPNALKADVKEVKPRKRWGGVHDEDEPEEDEEGKDEIYAKQTKRQKTSRYIRLTLVDLSTTQAAASGTGILHMMLFEADEVIETVEEDGYTTRRYKGGSGGAYEKYWKETEGVVVAILNPRVLKPQPVPGRPNIMTITPESADSIMVIGRARDLGSCQSIKRDGTACGEWCDARVNQFCDFHVKTALKTTSSRRAETYSSNSSITKTTLHNPAKFSRTMGPPGIHRATNSKPTFDAASKKGLLPRHNVSVLNDSTTYVMAGTSTTGRPSRDLLRSAALQSGNGSGGYIPGIREGPTVREAERAIEQEKKKKRATKKELQDLMKSDMGRSVGGTYLESAITRREEQEDEFRRKNGMKGKLVEKKKERVRDREEEGRREEMRKRSFPVTAVRLIGYDPSLSGDGPRDDDDETRRTRLAAISSLTANRPAPKLSAIPGAKSRSCVTAPARSSRSTSNDEELLDMRGEGGSDDDLVVEGAGGRQMSIRPRSVRKVVGSDGEVGGSPSTE